MKTREILRKLQLVLMLTLGMLPVAYCILGLLARELVGYSWVFSGVFGVFATVSLFLPGKLRLLEGILGALLMIVPCCILPSRDSWFIAATTAVIYSALLIWCMRIAGWDSTQEAPMLWGLVSLCAHLAAQLLVFLQLLQNYQPVLNVSFFAFAGLTMLSLNRQSLNLASGRRKGFSATMRRKNILLTLGMFSVALLLSLIPSVWNLVKLISHYLTELAQKLQQLLPEETLETAVTQVTEASEETYEYAFGGIEAREPNPTVYKIMTVVVLAVVIPFGCTIIYKVGKLFIKAVNKLAADVLHSASADTEDYEDEITDTRTEQRLETVLGERTKKRTPTRRRELSPREQIRFRYGQLARKNSRWHPQNTARENLPEPAAALYEKARYSEHPITAQDAQRFKEEAK